MSVKNVSTKIEKTCEGCGEVFAYELIDAPEDTILELQDWYTVVREIFIPDRGQWVKIMAQAHCLACVPTAAVKLAIPPPMENAPEIDLASLRTGNTEIN